MNRLQLGGVLVSTIVLVAALLGLTRNAAAPPTAPTLSEAPRGGTTVIVELYTSEGCSSCPPADDLLSALQRSQPVVGARVIALGQHVDYWNRLGWDDAFSSSEGTRRQREYATHFGNETIYTPQMIVDGREEFVGADRAAALAAIQRASRRPKAAVTIEPAFSETAREVDQMLRVRIGPLPDVEAREAADVMLAITESALVSEVERGENAGRTLRHDGVVRVLTRIARIPPGHRAETRLEPEIRVDAGWTGRLAAVIFVQERSRRRILGGGELQLPASSPVTGPAERR